MEQAKINYEQQMAELKRNYPEIPISNLPFEEILNIQVKGLKKQAKIYNTIFNCNERKQIKNCKFKQGDIMNLSEIYSPNSVDILLYRNALYHTLCTGNNMYRIMREDSIENMNKIASTNGLVVFGEDEFLQGINVNKVADIIRKNGFELVKTPNIDSQNI